MAKNKEKLAGAGAADLPTVTSQSHAPASPISDQTPPSPVATPTPNPPEPVKRVGIRDETLVELGIRNLDAAEAYRLTGFKGGPGIYIPYPGVEDKGAEYKSVQPFGRIRIPGVTSGKKYHQRFGTTSHNYIQPNISLIDGDLLLVEGEFKSISLTEAGFPAIGLSAFYSWGRKKDPEGTAKELVPAFAAVLAKLKPTRLVYFGDADTATNFGFWTAMTQLAFWSNLPVALPRIDYAAPNGKGVDDIRGNLSPDQFTSWVREAIRTAEIVLPGTTREILIARMLEREHESIRKLKGDDREKAKERLIKSGAYLNDTVLETLAAFAEETLGLKPASFKKDARAHRKKKEDEKKNKPGYAAKGGTGGGNDDGDEPATVKPPIDGEMLSRFVMVGKEFYTHTVDPATGKRSTTISICDKAFVYKSLVAAGYSGEADSEEDTPVCGRIPNLSEWDAALYYLHNTRCVAMADRLFRPYGPIVDESNGTRVFNNSQVQVKKPSDEIIDLHSDKIKFTITWLSYLLGGEQLHHFLSLLSYVYCAAYTGKPKKTRAVFLVGEPSSGKTLLIDYFIPRIFGQKTAADAHRLFRGEMGASSVLSSYVCKLSDADVGGSREAKRLQMGILALLADFTVSGRLLYQNVTTEEVINLFMFSTNPDGSTINVLRDMPPSVLEKFAVYHCGGGLNSFENGYGDPFSKELLDAKEDITGYLDKEMEHFCRLLLHWNDLIDWSEVSDTRFGVISYFAESVKKHFAPRDDEELIGELLRGHDFSKKTALYIYQTLYSYEENRPILNSIRPARFREVLIAMSGEPNGFVILHPYPGKEPGSVKNRVFEIVGKAYDQMLREKKVETDAATLVAANDAETQKMAAHELAAIKAEFEKAATEAVDILAAKAGDGVPPIIPETMAAVRPAAVAIAASGPDEEKDVPFH